MKTAAIYYGGFLKRAGGAFFHARNLQQGLTKAGWTVRLITLDDLPIWCRYIPHLVQSIVNKFRPPFGFLWKSYVTKVLYKGLLNGQSDIRIFEDLYVAWDSEIPSIVILHAVWSDNLQSYDISAERVHRFKEAELSLINRMTLPLVTVSQPYLKYLQEVHFAGRVRTPIRVVELGRNQEEFRRRRTVERKVKSMVYVGALEPRKNVGFMLEVVKELYSIDDSYHLTIVGNGQDEDTLADFARTHSLPVTFAGRMEFEDVVAELYLHDIYLHTSVKESFSYSLLEAKLAGLKTCAYSGLQVPAEFIDMPIPDFTTKTWCEGILGLETIAPKAFDVDRYTSERMAMETLKAIDSGRSPRRTNNALVA